MSTVILFLDFCSLTYPVFLKKEWKRTMYPPNTTSSQNLAGLDSTWYCTSRTLAGLLQCVLLQYQGGTCPSKLG
jgi:hypothetical protein